MVIMVNEEADGEERKKVRKEIFVGNFYNFAA